MRKCRTCDYWIMANDDAKEHSPTCPEPLQAEIARLRATLKAVCEDAFSDECPTDGKCDTYGHEEECGAVSAAAHAKNLREENKRLKESEVTAIKIGLDLDERNQVLESRLAQAREVLSSFLHADATGDSIYEATKQAEEVLRALEEPR